MPDAETTVPRAKVEELAALIRRQMELHTEQRATEAKLVRWCLQALNQTTEQAQRRLERERRHLPPQRQRVYMHETGQKVREDKALAMLYLEWLATRLEGSEPAGPKPEIVR